MRATAAEAQRQFEAARAAAAETVLRIEQVESAADPTPPPPPPVFTTRPLPNTAGQPNPAPVTRPSMPTATPDPAPANQIRPRVYVQIRDESQRDQANRAARALRDAKFIVPGIDVVSLGPSVTELRYLQDAEEDEAKRAVEVLKGIGIDATLRFVQLKVRSKARPLHYELWLAQPAAAR